jgi:hypothetical protein
LSRASTSSLYRDKKDVDGRDKPGHDVDESINAALNDDSRSPLATLSPDHPAPTLALVPRPN